MDKEMQNILIYRLEFILDLLEDGNNIGAHNEVRDLISEIEVNQVTPF